MANVVVTGVDGSETATLAAHKAAETAQAFGSSLHVVSAYGPGERRTLADGIEKVIINLVEDAERTVTQTVDELRQRYPDLTITASVENGNPADVLVDEAEKRDARLIVVGNKRVQGPARILGSVARSVTASATCDVYVANTRPS